MTDKSAFAIFYAGEAYSTASRMMGRQSAGKAFMKAVALAEADGQAHGVGADRHAAQSMLRQLRADGFHGKLHWSSLPSLDVAVSTGALYYPAPPPKDLAAARNLGAPAAFSLMGVTHSLSSGAALDLVADLVLPPFKPWDGLICTSLAARDLVASLHEDMRHYWREHIGATRFVQVQTPVIPLGVHVHDFAPQPGAHGEARAALGVRPEEVVFLCAGRLSFHAKAHPGALYQALEKVAGQHSVVCIEAGSFANEPIRDSYMAARQALAPSVRFLWIDGKDDAGYRRAWQGADVFVSLADNIQETFGLTPVEAMAAGLPAVVSDWNGYKETVRDGIDGYRIRTVLPPAGAGADLALRYALGMDSYDRYIGSASLATVVDPMALAQALGCLAGDPERRARMGAAGRQRAAADFDWPAILRRYADFAGELGALRGAHVAAPAQAWPQRRDPFQRYAHFPSHTLDGNWRVSATADAPTRLRSLLALSMSNYAFASPQAAEQLLPPLLAAVQAPASQTVGAALAAAGLASPAGMRALMWLWKFDLIEVAPR